MNIGDYHHAVWLIDEGCGFIGGVAAPACNVKYQ